MDDRLSSNAIAQQIAEPRGSDEAKRRQIDPDHAPPWHADPAVVKTNSRRRSTNFEESSVPAYTLPDPLAGPWNAREYRKDGFDDGVRGLFARAALGPQATAQNRKPNDWGAIAAWSWGASRVLDYLETVPEIDASRVAVIGHSRGGKTAAWTAARDPRFAAALVNNSGSGGAALFRRRFGETIAHSVASFPYWYAAAFANYTNREDQLPVDQHQLMALIAPRAVAVSSADEDLWADPRGEYLSLVHAAPVFSLLGEASITQESMPPLGQPRVVGPTGYQIRLGAHDLHEGDWAFYLDFLDRQWKEKAKTLPPQ